MQWCGFARGVTQEACRCFNLERGTPSLYLSISEVNQLRSHSAPGNGSFSGFSAISKILLICHGRILDYLKYVTGFLSTNKMSNNKVILFFSPLASLTSLSCYLSLPFLSQMCLLIISNPPPAFQSCCTWTERHQDSCSGPCQSRNVPPPQTPCWPTLTLP